MNFPDTPFFHLVYWFLNTAGIGGVFSLILATSLITGFFLAIRWVVMGAKADENEVYSYPTSSLIEH